MREPGSSRSRATERKTWLKKAIAAYRRTLKIEVESVAAHYGLGLALGDPAWGGKEEDVDESPEPAATSDALVAQLPGVADRKTAAAERIQRAVKLAGDVFAVHEGPAAEVPIAARSALRGGRATRVRPGRTRAIQQCKPRSATPWSGLTKRFMND